MKNLGKSSFILGTLLAALLCLSDTASAQNGTLTSNPPQLTFSSQGGTTPAAQTITITSSAGAVNISVSASSRNNWLTVTPPIGTTPVQLTVSVNPALSNLTTDSGFINVSADNQFLAIPVQLNVNSSGPSPLSASPNSLSFSFAANSTVPASNSVSISSSSSSITTFSATASTNDGGNWLTVNPTSGNLPGSIQVTANPSALSGSGPFKAVIAINAPGTTGITVPVLVTLAGTPAIQIAPNELDFAWQVGTTGPAAQTLSITSSTGANVAFTATAKSNSCGNWLVISPQSGATPSSITAQVNTSGLTTNALCSGEVDIAAPGASNPTVAVQVSLLVSTSPLLLVPTTGPTFNYQIGTSTQIASQNIQITSSSTPLNFTATAAPNNNGPNFLTITPGTAATPQSVGLGVNPTVLATLGPGTYSETVTVSSPGAGNPPQTFVVTLNVSSNPLLSPTVSSLTFNYQIGKTAPPSQTVTIGSTGAPLNYQVNVTTNNCSGFLSATVNGGTSGITFGNQNQLVVAVTTTGLTTPQVCTGDITLSVPNSSTPAVDIPVTLNVSDKALLNVSTNSINLTVLTGALPTTQTVSVTSTDSTVLPFTATATTDPVGLTWLSVAPNTGNTPNNLLIGINPANLGVGTYDGNVTITSPGLPSQVIHAHLVVVASNVAANPASVTLSETIGGTAASQTVSITGVPSGTTIGAIPTMLSGSGWLTVTTSGNTVTVNADATHLSPGSYSGVVTVIIPGVGNSPLYIPVTFNVSASNSFSLTATSVSFSFQAGGTVPGSKTVQLTTTNGTSVPFTASFTPTGTSSSMARLSPRDTPAPANLITVSPTSGNTPATLTIALNSSVLNTLAAGTYTGNVVIASPNLPGGDATIAVSVTVSGSIVPSVTAMVNAASFIGGPVSPGELVTIFGTNLGPMTGVNFTPRNDRVDTSLGNVTVMFNNTAAPLIYVSATQINLIVPYEVASNASVNVTVNYNSMTSASFSIAVTDTAPGMFSKNQTGNGQGAILNTNLSGNSSSNPAPVGSSVSIFATGEGVLTPPVATGTISGPSLPLPKPVAGVSVTIAGKPAEVTYYGSAPTLVAGVMQINVTIPDGTPSGNQLVVLKVGNNTTAQQSITVAVQ